MKKMGLKTGLAAVAVFGALSGVAYDSAAWNVSEHGAGCQLIRVSGDTYASGICPIAERPDVARSAYRPNIFIYYGNTYTTGKASNCLQSDTTLTATCGTPTTIPSGMGTHFLYVTNLPAGYIDSGFHNFPYIMVSGIPVTLPPSTPENLTSLSGFGW